MSQFEKFRSDNVKPSVLPPPGTCDCQIHVFGDPERYPVRRNSAYPPPVDATIDVALKMHRTLGITRGVIVQSTVHGTDHRILYDALKRAGLNYRGVAIVNDEVNDAELRRLDGAGVRGARFNFWKQLNIAPSPDEFRRSIKRIREFGWFAKIHAAGDEWLELAPLLREVDIPIIIDHIGHIDLTSGRDKPVVQLFKHLLKSGNWWLMISNADRYSTMDAGWEDVLPLVKTLTHSAPDKVLWATDWPHVQYTKAMPTDTALLELLYRILPEPEARQKVLCDNPKALLRY